MIANFIVFLITFLFTNPNPVQHFASEAMLPKLNSDLDFWQNKVKQSPDQYIYHVRLAAAHSQRFQLLGHIDDLLMAGGLLDEASRHTPANQRSGVLRMLAQNYISRHEFCLAENVMKQAEALEDGERDNALILFDLAMEMGQDKKAKAILVKLSSVPDFQYLIRRAKWEDKNGNLDGAILWLKDAASLAQKQCDVASLIWAYTNLGDFYGHAGEVDKYRNYHQKALKLQPDNWYAKRALVWADYVEMKDYAKTSQDLETLEVAHVDPSILLWKSDLAKLQHDENKHMKYLEEFVIKASDPRYGRMYHTYLSDIFCQPEFLDGKQALSLARAEVDERPTAESYSLLVQAFIVNGYNKQAAQVSENFVLGRTEEPKALLRLVKMNTFDTDMQNRVKEVLEGAFFELGPAYEENYRN